MGFGLAPGVLPLIVLVLLVVLAGSRAADSSKRLYDMLFIGGVFWAVYSGGDVAELAIKVGLLGVAWGFMQILRVLQQDPAPEISTEEMEEASEASST